MITIYFTRHAISCRNLYDTYGRPDIPGVNDLTFRDTPLSPDGIEQIIRARDATVALVGPVDAILTSPLKRCLETTLLTYHRTDVQCPIYAMSLLQEYCTRPESTCSWDQALVPVDPSLVSYRNYGRLDCSTFLTVGADNWTSDAFRADFSRTQQFFEFLRVHFAGKRVHVVSHGWFLNSFLGWVPANYQTVCAQYNTETGLLEWRTLKS